MKYFARQFFVFGRLSLTMNRKVIPDNSQMAMKALKAIIVRGCILICSIYIISHKNTSVPSGSDEL